MNTNPRSILLLVLLSSIVVFFVGFRFGKRIERLDKNYISPTPFVTDAPTPTKEPTTFDTFIHEDCQLSFLHPKGMDKKSASDGATLTSDTESIDFTCEDKAVADFIKNHPSTSEGKMTRSAGQNVRVFSEKDFTSWSAFNTQSGNRVIFTVSSGLTDLVLKTLEFN